MQEHVTWTLLQRLMYLTCLILVIYRHDGNKCVGFFCAFVSHFLRTACAIWFWCKLCVFRTAFVTVIKRWREWGVGGGGCCSGWPYDAMLWQECYETAWRQRLLKLGYWSSRAQSSNHRFLFCFSSHPETQAFTSFCFFLSRTLFPLPCFSKQLIFFFSFFFGLYSSFLVTAPVKCAPASWCFYSCTHVQILMFLAFFLHNLSSQPFECVLFFPLSLSPPLCTISSKAPLFCVSLDNGSDTLTSVLT